MATKNHNIGIDIAYHVDKTSLTQLKQELAGIRLEASNGVEFKKLTDEMKQVYTSAEQLEHILDKSWNSKLGQLDLSKVNKSITETFGSVEKLKSAFEKQGTLGQTTYNHFASMILNTNLQLKQTSKLLDDMAVSMGNTIKWGFTSSIFNNLTSSLQKAWDYSVRLNSSLTDIRIVTDKSAEDMERFAQSANKAAKNLGSSTQDFAEAALIYYQQGDDDKTAQTKAGITLKAANVTGQSGEEVSEQLTAVWNGYKVEAAEAELYVDKLAAVAARTASDLEELSTGMSKVASAANLMGVDVDQLNATLATVISVTRQAPESVGTAFKTIYARMGDIEAGLDAETTLGSYTAEMEKIAGVNVLDASGKLRDMGDVIEEVGAKWGTLSREQQIALSQVMAGTRQYNNLLALFDNWGMYTDALDESANAAGTLNKQQNIYMQSTEAHLQRLSTEAEKTYNTIFDQDTANSFIDTLTSGLSVVNTFLDGLGGGMSSLIGLGGVLGSIFNKQLGASLERTIENLEARRNNLEGEDLKRKIIETHAAKGDSIVSVDSRAVELEAHYAQQILDIKTALTEEEAQELILRQQELGALESKLENIEQYRDIAKELRDLGKLDIVDVNSINEDDFVEGLEKVNKELDEMRGKKQELDELFGLMNTKFKQSRSARTFGAEQGEIANYKNLPEQLTISEDFNSTDTEKMKKTNDGTLKYKIEEKKLYKELLKLGEEDIEVKELAAKYSKTHYLSQKDIEKVYKAQGKQMDKQKDLINKMKRSQEGYLNVISGNHEQIKLEKEQREEVLKKMIEQKQRAQDISNAVQGISAATTGMTAAINLGTVLGDAFAEGEMSMDRFKNSLISIIMLLPQLISGYKAIMALSVWDKLAAQKEKNIFLNSIEITQNKMMTAAQAKKLVANKLEEAQKKNINNLTKEEIALQLIQNGSLSAATAAKAGLLTADQAENAAKKKGIVTTVASTVAQWAHNAAMYASPVMWIALIILGVVAAIAALTAALINSAKAQREDNKAKIEAANADQEKINKNLELYDSYLKLHEAYKEDATKKQEMIEAAEALGDAIDQELVRTAKLTDNYDLLTEAVKNAKNAALTEKAKSTATEYSAAKSNLEETARKDEGKKSGDDYIINFNQGMSGSDGDDEAQDILDEYVDTYSKSGNKFTTEWDTESIVKQYDQMQEAFNEMQAQGISTDSELYKQTRDYLEKMREDVEIYKEAINDVNATKIEQALFSEKITKNGKLVDNENYIDFTNIENDADFEKKKQELIDYLETLEGYGDKSQKELEQIAQTYIKGVSASADEYLDRLALINNMTERVKDSDIKGKNFFDRLKSEYITGHEEKEMQEVLRGLSTEQLTQISSLDDNQLNMHLTAFTSDGTSVPEAIKQIAEAYSAAAKETVILTNATKAELEELEVSEDAFKRYTEHIMNSTKGLKDNAEAAQNLALRNIKLNKGLTTLGDNWDDWKKVLKNSSADAIDYHETMSEMGKAMKDIFGMDVSNNFIEKHLKEIGALAEGDVSKLKELQQEATKDYVANMTIIAPDDEINGIREKLTSFVNEFSGKEVKLGTSIEELDTSGYIKSLNKMLEQGQITADQANAILSGIGYSPDIKMVTVPSNPINHTYSTTILGKKLTWTVEEQTTLQVPQIDAKGTTFTGRGSAVSFANTKKGKDSSKGGGGNDPKFEELLESEKDRYHDINIELKNISNNLEEVQAKTDRLVGQSKIDNLADQYKLLNDQIDATGEKIDIARGEMSELQAELAGKGVNFNSDGTIANYAAAYDAQLAYVNSIVSKYNGMNAKQQEAYQSTLDKAKEDFEKFTEAIDNYDTLLTDTIPGMQAEIQEALNEQIELKLDAFHHEIELRLEMAEAERDWNEFFNKVIKDIDEEDILGNAQARLQDFMSYYKDNLEGVVQVGTQHIEDILTDLKAMDVGKDAKYYSKDGVDNRAQALEDLKTYYEQLMEDLESIHDLSDEIHESYVDMIDEAQEKFDEQISTFETINDLIEHDKNVISMIYGEEAYSSLSQFYDRQEENYNKQLDFQRQQVEFWKMQMDTAEEGSDAWNAAKENWLSAVDEWNGAIETAIQNLQDKYLNAINAIFQNLNNNVTNGMGLDFVETEWDLINQNADQYLDTVNAIYKVQELQNKYLDAIDKTDSPAQQKKLNDLMQQETDYLREQDKLSEYDLERANLKYELALKQIALEEAQQNKTQLRLRRDSQGNYTYQYTQDDDQVASIQSEIANLYNQLYNLDAEQYKGNLEEIYSIWNEFQERMAEAAQINDPEQRAAKELLIKQQYSDLINGLVEKNENLQANLYQSTMSHLFDLYDQNAANYADMSEDQKAILDMFINAETDLTGAAFDNMFDLYNINIEQFKNMTDEQKDILMSSMIPQWDSGVQQMTDKIAGEGGFIPTCKDAFEELDQATEDYMTGLEELQKNADVSFEDVKKGINKVVVETEELLKDNGELIGTYEKELLAIKGVIDELDILIKKYQDAELAAKAATEEAYKYWQQEQNKNAEVDANLDKPEENKPAPTNNAPVVSAPAEPAKPSLAKGSYVEVKPGTRWYADSYGGGGSGYARAGTIKYTSSGPYGYNIGGLGWVRKTDIVGYDTGGYTGEWSNNNGRLAMLHQKELVLNANDTANMLSAITILRDITANLGATLLNKMASISAGNPGSIGQGLAAAGMEQNVVINAEFPNATNSREIEDALNNLVNRASQHIQRN